MSRIKKSQFFLAVILFGFSVFYNDVKAQEVPIVLELVRLNVDSKTDRITARDEIFVMVVARDWNGKISTVRQPENIPGKKWSLKEKEKTSHCPLWSGNVPRNKEALITLIIWEEDEGKNALQYEKAIKNAAEEASKEAEDDFLKGLLQLLAHSADKLGLKDDYIGSISVEVRNHQGNAGGSYLGGENVKFHKEPKGQPNVEAHFLAAGRARYDFDIRVRKKRDPC